MARPVALITGASSGIGHSLALEYARRGFDVVALARRIDRLSELAGAIAGAGGSALPIACDVCVDGALDDAVARALERFGRLDVAIANAGISVAGKLADLELDDYRRVFETNLFGVLRTAYAVRRPLEASRGSFAVIGSVNGYLTLPVYSAYAASKHAVRSLTDALYFEWAPAGVSVTHVAPGFIETEIRRIDNAGTLSPDREDPIPRWLVMPADVAARQIAGAVAARRREIVLTGHGKAGAFLARHAPGAVGLALRAAGSRIVNTNKKRGRGPSE